MRVTGSWKPEGQLPQTASTRAAGEETQAEWPSSQTAPEAAAGRGTGSKRVTDLQQLGFHGFLQGKRDSGGV